jgi:hypothetical protein
MNNDMVNKLVEETHYAGEADDFGAGTDDGEYFELCHYVELFFVESFFVELLSCCLLVRIKI